MGRINTVRVLLGGVVAGIVANALDYVINMYLVKEEGDAMVQRLLLRPEAVDSSIYTWAVVDMIWGVLLVFTYAGMRPRFGPGPKTAMITGALLWFTVVIVIAGFTSMGIFTQAAFMKTSALMLANALISSLIGAYLYKEDE